MSTTYFTEYASPAKSSRVAVRARSYDSLEPRAQLSNAPEFLYVDPSGARVVVRYPSAIDVFTLADGLLEEFASLSHAQPSVLVESWGIVYLAYERDWSGHIHPEPTFHSGFVQSGRQVASSLRPGRLWTSVAQQDTQTHARVNREIYAIWQTRIKPDRSEPRWFARFPGWGNGAIASDGRVAIVMIDGRFVVLNAGAPGTYHAATLVETKLDNHSYVVSIVEPGFAVFSARYPPNTDTLSWNEDGLMAYPPQDFEFRRRWSTGVRRLDAGGRTLWSAEVPFEARQPPIDGDGRIYVAGEGLAAVENGKVLWGGRSDVRVRATAFEDGTLAVAVGSKLRIVNRDGTIEQELATKDGEVLTTPPAIASDGAVWVASAKHLYVAR
jgi:hypothetical protein